MRRLLPVRGTGHAGGHNEPVHPLSTALLLIGYGLSLPIGAKLPAVVRHQHRIALIGHQLGVLIVAAGWLLAGRTIIALTHALWFALVRLWFWHGRRRSAANASTAGAS